MRTLEAQADLHCRLQEKDLVVHIRHKINVTIFCSIEENVI